MNKYEFTLKFALPREENLSAIADKLYGAGCDDALIGIGTPGRVALQFEREAQSAQVAFDSALQNIRRILPEAKLIEATPDLVGLSDLASILNVSRQYARKLSITASAVPFPAPIHEGKSALWHLSPVLSWLSDYHGKQFDDNLMEIATVAQRINIAKDLTPLSGKEQCEITELANGDLMGGWSGSA